MENTGGIARIRIQTDYRAQKVQNGIGYTPYTTVYIICISYFFFQENGPGPFQQKFLV